MGKSSRFLFFGDANVRVGLEAFGLAKLSCSVIMGDRLLLAMRDGSFLSSGHSLGVDICPKVKSLEEVLGLFRVSEVKECSLSAVGSVVILEYGSALSSSSESKENPRLKFTEKMS